MIVMTPEATEAHIAAVRKRLETTGVHVLVLPGALTTAIGAIGDPQGVRELAHDQADDDRRDRRADDDDREHLEGTQQARRGKPLQQGRGGQRDREAQDGGEGDPAPSRPA